ncbi:hypothetical protein SAMN05421630_11517 [Prauserella marina]|uniref:Uncharacterized protein n=1 Tax=Prauserella marina TaxID=530584 RepID=A0A1G6YYE9_9PSEU|nr:hypothetical protein [Prauserella marina]PWV71379.1 hypothetical protein DES30_11295 [Prauserella marina]SDD95419.1 hypothetical protein SAMN05421630_11517 [Prauserella marina]
MIATLSENELPTLALAATDRPERPAVPVPVGDCGFMAMLREAEPDLAHAQQSHRADGEVLHVWRHAYTHEYVVLIVRDNGRHGVKESGAPLYDRLSQLAGMWLASESPRRGGAR